MGESIETRWGALDPNKVIRYPLITEDAFALIEAENKLVFIVERTSSREDIKRAAEALYEVEVEKVNTAITPQGLKKAYIKLKPPHSASNVAMKLGIM